MSSGLDLSQFYETFFDEADELLAQMEQLLLELDVGAPDIEQLNAIFRAGLHGIENKSQVAIPPESARPKDSPAERLPNSLEAAVERFSAKGSVARQIFGDEFVDYFTVTRSHELRQWREAVTDW
mgnify:CR=1 FL=1